MAGISGMIIGSSWVVFVFVWAILATVYGPGARRNYSPRARLIRLAVFILFLLAMIYGANLRPFGEVGDKLAVAGAVFAVGGLAFAIWARVTLGSNWGMPMTLHADPELVTSGPYRFVRHPIYTGLSAMFVGTALAFPLTVLPCAIVIAYTLYGARREERDMEQRFADKYRDYRRRSKFLVPFLF